MLVPPTGSYMDRRNDRHASAWARLWLVVVVAAVLLTAGAISPRRPSPASSQRRPEWPLRNDYAVCHFLRRARPLAELTDSRLRLALAHQGLAEAYRRLNCALYTASYPGPVLNGAVLASIPSYHSEHREVLNQREQATYCLTLLREQQALATAADKEVPESWRQVKIDDALSFIDSGDFDWNGVQCDAFALAGMLGRTDWGRELEERDDMTGEDIEKVTSSVIPSLDLATRVCSWLLKKMGPHVPETFDNRVLGFRVYVHSDFRKSVMNLFQCGSEPSICQECIRSEKKCLAEWKIIWKHVPESDDTNDDNYNFAYRFQDLPLEDLTMHVSAPLDRLTGLHPDRFRNWNRFGCNAFVVSALTLAGSRKDDIPCEGTDMDKCVDNKFGMQLVDISFPCETSTTQTLERAEDAVKQKLCDPHSYMDATPVYPVKPPALKNLTGKHIEKGSYTLKGGFIPGSTNIALFFETQLVMARLTKRLLVLPPRGGLIDHLYASGPVDYLIGVWTKRRIERFLNEKQDVWTWQKFVSFMLKRLASSQTHASKIKPIEQSTISVPLLPYESTRSISLLRWMGRQFYCKSDLSNLRAGRTRVKWPLDNVEDFNEKFLHVIGGGRYWMETFHLTTETKFHIEASLSLFRTPTPVVASLVETAISAILLTKPVNSSNVRYKSFKSVQLRLGDIKAVTGEKIGDTIAIISELKRYGYTAEDRIYLATDDDVAAPFLDQRILDDAFPLLVRRQNIDILGQECQDPLTYEDASTSDIESTVSPWSLQNNNRLEGPRCAALEQALCSRADVFVGCRWSSFGPRIALLRAAEGKESLWFADDANSNNDGNLANQQEINLLMQETHKVKVNV